MFSLRYFSLRSLRCHENVAWKVNSHFFSLYQMRANPSGAEFLSTIYPSSRERKFSHCLFKSFTKREIRHFHVVVLQWRQKNVQPSVMHVQSCCFALSSHFFFTFSSPLHLKHPIIYDTLWSIRNRIFLVQSELLLLVPSKRFSTDR